MTAGRYRNVELLNPSPFVNRIELAAFVDTFPVSLPHDYADFLKQTNGGIPCPSGIPITDVGSQRRHNIEAAENILGNLAFSPRALHSEIREMAEIWKCGVYTNRLAWFTRCIDVEDSDYVLALSSIRDNVSWSGTWFWKSLIPIACDVSGLLFLLSCHRESYGTVYHGLEGYGYLFDTSSNEDDYDDLTLCRISDSFSEFLDSLVVPTIWLSAECKINDEMVRSRGFDGYVIERQLPNMCNE